MTDKIENKSISHIPFKKRPYIPRNEEIEVHTRNATKTAQAEVMVKKRGRKNKRKNNNFSRRILQDEIEKNESVHESELEVNENKFHEQIKVNNSSSIEENIQNLKFVKLKNQIGKVKSEVFFQKVSELHNEMLKNLEDAMNRKEIKLKSIQDEFDAERLALISKYEKDIEQLLSEAESEGPSHKKKSKKNTKKKIPVLVEGPYIVYQLREEEILEDLELIKKAIEGR